MNTDQLRQILLDAHKRDKRLTFVNMFLIFAFLAVISTLLYIYAYEHILKAIMNMIHGAEEMANSPETPFYYKLIIPFVVISLISVPLFNFISLSKRPKRIEKFVKKIESGLIALSVDQHTVYKITLPLLKVNIRLAPVENISVVLDQDTTLKSYVFPFESHAVSDLKILLSGVNSQQIGKTWDELYIGSDEKTELKEYDLKPEEEFKSFVENTLSEDIQQMDVEREQGKKMYFRYLIFSIIIIVLCGGGYAYLNYSGSGFNREYLIYAFMTFFGIFYLFFFISKGLKKKTPIIINSGNSFKTKILKPMIEFINPNFQFILHGHISLPELLDTGILVDRHYKLNGNDQIMGNHKGVPFQLSDLEVEFQRNFTGEKEGPDLVFVGQVFIAKFNKSFNSEVYIIPKKTNRKKAVNALSETLTLGMASTKKTDIDLYTSNDYGKKVELEDPEFMKLFNVYSHDQVEARYLLTPAMMERIKTLSKSTEGDLHFSFKNDRISLLNNSGRNNFEAGMFKSISKDNNQMLVGFYKDLCDQLKIIEDLKLNINIWNKN